MLDDHYRRIAEANRKGRRMADVVPNNPDEFRSRVYSAHLRNNNDGLPRQADEASINRASTNAMFVSLARREISCPECGAKAGQPCRSMAKDKSGKELDGLHYQRISAAKLAFARKS